MKSDPQVYSEVVWEGAGRYAWRTRANGMQRWIRVGKADTPLLQTLSIVAQWGLIDLTWANLPEDLNISNVESQTHEAGT